MAQLARLYGDDRLAERFEADRDATLRAGGDPVDIVVENLSATGFFMTGGPALFAGAIVDVGLAGIGRRQARIERVEPTGCGCRFLAPLGRGELEAALVAEVPATAERPLGDAAPAPASLTPATRMAIIAGTAAGLWALLIGGALALR